MEKPMNKTQIRAAELDAEIKRLAAACKLDAWNAFVDPMTVPSDMFPALMTGRPQLIALITPRSLSAEEAAPLFQMIATLIATNQALQDHAAQVAHMVETWAAAFDQLRSVGDKIERFATFDHMSATAAEDEEDDAA